MPKTILIIEDEAAIRDILSEPLICSGYEVVTAGGGLSGLEAFRTHTIDLVLLDILLPELDGYSVCRQIRKDSQVPIILLTALDTEDEQVRGFDLLADDYITKPFSIRLVLKRVEALLRRSGREDADDILSCGDLKVSPSQRRVLVRGLEIPLTHLEFDILLLFMKNMGRVFTRDELLNHVWGYEFIGDERGVNFHIMNLRRKLGVDYIETVRGVGYKLAKKD